MRVSVFLESKSLTDPLSFKAVIYMGIIISYRLIENTDMLRAIRKGVSSQQRPKDLSEDQAEPSTCPLTVPFIY